MKQLFFSFVFLLFLWTCTIKEQTISFDPSLPILFSKDSVIFDTLISQIKSPTQRLKVYNPNDVAVQLKTIHLANGTNSDYQLLINGRKTHVLNDEVLLGNDSLLILIDIKVSYQNENLPQLVKDSIIITWNKNVQDIKLIAWGQDVVKIEEETICDRTFTHHRPYFISNVLSLQENCTLTIEKGTKIYFGNHALMQIYGTLYAVGNADSNIVFTNSRFDNDYKNISGQWQGIRFMNSSTGNEMSYVTISNAEVGIQMLPQTSLETPILLINNTKIFNMSETGILTQSTNIKVINSLIYNCKKLIEHFGGNYEYIHCTLTNDNSNFINKQAALSFFDYYTEEESQINNVPLNISIVNSIIWGKQQEELFLPSNDKPNVNIHLLKNIIRSQKEITMNYHANDFNFPGFKDPLESNYALDTLAFAQDKGTPTSVTIDIENRPRDEKPDIGAYERINNTQK